MNRKIPFTLTILLLTITLNISCKKARFDNFGNAIKGLIPEECEECALIYIWADEENFWEGYDWAYLNDGNYDDESVNYASLFEMNYSGPGDEFYARIDWENEPLATPGEGMRYAIVNLDKSSGGLDEDQILYLTETKMKPRVVYEWDFDSNELVKTDEKTDRIGSRPSRPSGSTGSNDDDDDGGNDDGIPSNPNGTYQTKVYDRGYGVTGQKTLTINLGADNTGSGTWTWFEDYRNHTINEYVGTETSTHQVSLRPDPNKPGQLLMKCLQKRVVRSNGYDKIRVCFTYEIPVRFSNGGLYVDNGDGDPIYSK